MKKLLLAVLVSAFCLSATNAFAQKKTETQQEKMIRLEVENRVLNEQITRLTEQIVTLQVKMAELEKKQQSQATTLQNTASKPVNTNTIPLLGVSMNPYRNPSTNTQRNTSALKPYYANMDIQKKFEKWPRLEKWAAHEYKKMKHKIISAKEIRTFEEPSKIFGGHGHTVYELIFTIDLWSENRNKLDFTYSRTGCGRNPLSWNEELKVLGPLGWRKPDETWEWRGLEER